MIAELTGARIVVFNALSSNRADMGAKSLVKPAKMLIDLSPPRTVLQRVRECVGVRRGDSLPSERITVSESPGGGELGVGGMAGVRMGFWFWRWRKIGEKEETRKGAERRRIRRIVLDLLFFQVRVDLVVVRRVGVWVHKSMRWIPDDDV